MQGNAGPRYKNCTAVSYILSLKGRATTSYALRLFEGTVVVKKGVVVGA